MEQLSRLVDKIGEDKIIFSVFNGSRVYSKSYSYNHNYDFAHSLEY